MATDFDNHGNLLESAVTAAPSPADSGLTLSVSEAFGDLLAAVGVPFNMPVYPINTRPTLANCEFIRVTAVAAASGGNRQLTIVRTQEGSSARSIIVGDRIALAITAKSFTDIESAVNTLENGLIDGSGVTLGNDTLDNILHTETISGEEVAVLGEGQDAAVLTTSVIFDVYRNAAYNFTGTETTLVFDTEVIDDSNSYDTGTGIFTVPTSGRYVIYANMGGVSSDGVRSSMTVYRNSTQILRMSATPGGNFSPYAGGMAVIDLTAGDTLQCKIQRETSGTSAGAAGAYAANHFGGYLAFKTPV